MEIIRNVPLAQYTSWLIGGPAEEFCMPGNLKELKQAITYAKQNHLKITILGSGSNVLISDKGIKGLVICLRKFSGVEYTQIPTPAEIESGESYEIHFSAYTGTAKSELLKIFLKYKMDPAIFLAGIPGDVGGGVVMNAGIGESVQPREFVEIVEWVEVLREDQIIRIEKEKLLWSYRHCKGWEPGVITKVGFGWHQKKIGNVMEKVKLANQTRLKKQPLEWPSCGSVFVNPAGHKAGQLIESSGLKGFQIGNAQISPKHSNFIVNLGGATAQDVRQLIEHIKKSVFEQHNVILQTEVQFLGEF